MIGCLVMVYYITSTITVLCTLVGGEHYDLTNIDMLNGRYLEMEKILWEMTSYTDKEMLLQRVHDIHVAFFSEKFGERNTSIFILDENQENLNNAFYYINDHVLEAIPKLSLYSESKFKNNQIIDFSRRVISVVQKNMEIINNVTIGNDFFRQIAIVNKQSIS